MTAAAPEASLCAVQTIELQCSSNTTFLLSGWGKADSIPDLAGEIEGKNDTSLKYWGITLTLNYSGGMAPEYFHLPINDARGKSFICMKTYRFHLKFIRLFLKIKVRI